MKLSEEMKCKVPFELPSEEGDLTLERNRAHIVTLKLSALPLELKKHVKLHALRSAVT